jgi:hypothetical protein
MDLPEQCCQVVQLWLTQRSHALVLAEVQQQELMWWHHR